MSILFAPFTITLYSTNNDMSIFIGNTYFCAIRWPFHIFDKTGLTIIDHFFDPLSIVFHEDNDRATCITGSQFTIFVIPDYE